MEACAAGVIHLGLAPAQFWNLTLREIRALYRAYEREQEREDWRTAKLCETFAAGHLKHQDGRPFTVQDFLPTKYTKTQVDAGAQSADDQFARLRAWAYMQPPGTVRWNSNGQLQQQPE